MLKSIKIELGRCRKFLIESLLQTLSPFGVLLLSLVLTGLAWHYTTKTVEKDSQIDFKLQVSEAKNSLDFRLKTYINILEASQGLFAASKSVERDEWKAFVQSLNLQTLYQGIKGMGFIRYVPHSRKAFYEQQVKGDPTVDRNGYPDFAIKPAGDRPTYFVIEYIEPFLPNRAAMGFDINSEPMRRAAAERARDTGQVAVTGRVVLVQDPTKQPGLLILLPVYDRGMPHSTVEEKRRALLGFVYTPLRIKDLIEEALPNARQQGLELKIYHNKELMYDSDRLQQVDRSKLQKLLHQETSLNVAGETWQLYFTHQTSKAFWMPTPILVLSGGTLISFLLFGIMRSLMSSRQRAFQLASRMTAELSVSNAELQTEIQDRKQAEVALQNSQLLLDGVLNSSLDGVMAFRTLRDCQGKIVDFQWLLVNPAAEKMIGRTSDELIGKQMLKEMPEHLHQGLFAFYIRVVETGEPLEREFYYEHDGIKSWFLITAVKLEDGFTVTFRDISERKRIEMVLQQSEERYRLMVEDQTELIARFNLDGKLTFVNQAYCRYFGRQHEELIGSSFKPIIFPEDRQKYERHLDSLILENSPETIEYRVMVDGQVRHLQWSDRVICDRKGNFCEFQAVGRDISDRKKAEEELHQSEEFLKRLITSSADCIKVLNLDGQLLFMSTGGQLLMEIEDFSSYQNALWLEFWQHEEQNAAKSAIEIAKKGGVGKFQAFSWTAKGNPKWWEVVVTPIIDANGQPEKLLSVSRDITERKQMEMKINESEERFRLAFNDAAIGMALVSPEGRFLQVNRSLCEIVGYSKAELLVKSFQSITYADDLEADLNYIRQILDNKIHTYQMEKRYIHKNGQLVWILLCVSLVRDKQGKPLYFIAQIQNISARKKIEEQIAASLTEKEILLKEVHHRVKNNLQIIDSLFRHQCRYLTEPTIIQILKECQNRVSSMALLHEKLYQSKDLAHIDVGEYLQSLVANLYDFYRINGVSPTVEIDVKSIFVELEIALTCGLIVNELVSNCLKYAFPNGKKGYLKIQLIDDEQENLTLTVKDNGIGLPKDFVLEKTKSLGLKLVKSFVRQLQGTIEVNSDRGTEFTILFKA